MSFEAMAWAVDKKCDNAGQKLVLLMLANHSNGHTGQCNPSHKRLAENCSMGISTLKRHIASLEAAGFLFILHKGKDGVSLPNQYILKLEGVGPNRAGGGSKSDGGVGPNRATNQELKPGSKPNTDAGKPAELDGFIKFWEVWPAGDRKQAKGKCFDAWKKAHGERDAAAILAHVEKLKLTTGWTKNGGEFIPAPLVYLNKRSWEGAEDAPAFQERFV